MHASDHASAGVPQIMWAACVYIEAVSVLPQLRMMQNAKVVEKFTAHYVFALGLSRFISCAHWILQIIDGDSFLLQVLPFCPVLLSRPCVSHWAGSCSCLACQLCPCMLYTEMHC